MIPVSSALGVLAKRKYWTIQQIAVLVARYPNEKTEAIAASVSRPVRAVYHKARALGLKKSAEYLASPAACRTNGRQGTGTRFEKGLTPWNKGMKGLRIGGEKTQFKPGAMPHNTQPIGSYRLDKNGSLQRKISNNKGNNSKRWRGVHELLWVEANGPVPAKHIVIFKPEQRTNNLEEITLDRVECVSLAENMRRNTRHNLPKEINEVIQLRAVLTRHINKRSKNHERTEENN